MPDIVNPLPYRRPELVSQPLGENGSYLVRDRRAGESFTLGPQEHFLLARLDGTQAADELRAAFAARFDEALTEEELEDFLQLAHDRGFLQGEDSGATRSSGEDWHESVGRICNLSHRAGRICKPSAHPDGLKIRPTLVQRFAAQVLGMVAGLVQWLGSLLSGAAGTIQLFNLRHCEFVPRPDDIFIVTYPRSGTTWMQMILYQLTTDGDMDFPHINEYCPWFERSIRSADGFEGRPSPRLFKSHLAYRQIPRGLCKYIYIARDGKDVAVSYFHFSRSHLGFRGTFDEFFDLFMRGNVEGGSWFEHVKSWWRHRKDSNVLFLRYEDLIANLETCVRKIIAFCGLEVAPERIPTIVERCSFAFMKQHENQFDHLTGTLWEQGLQLNAFLRRGKCGDGRERLSPQQTSRFARVCHLHAGGCWRGQVYSRRECPLLAGSFAHERGHPHPVGHRTGRPARLRAPFSSGLRRAPQVSRAEAGT
jgi:hypothetical protein